MTNISAPTIDTRSTQPYLGIRTVAPFKGMFAVVDRLRKELVRWLQEHRVEPAGPFFLRYHVIDMRGEMDITFGVVVSTAAHAGDERVIADVLPAGRYASLVYVGSGLAGNKALLEWIRDTEGIRSDRWESDAGDHFSCRYEAYLTDPALERRKTKWQIEVAIKLADDLPQ
jgi:effector-binding domain-containing protein